MASETMKKALTITVLAVFALAACATGTEGDRLTVNEKICIRSLEQLSDYLGGREELVEDEATAFEFFQVAAAWAQGDRPIDVRQWVDDAQLIHRIVNNCGSPETSVLVPIGGRTRLVDITVRPAAEPRPARRGRVDILDLPPGEADEEEAVEELQE